MADTARSYSKPNSEDILSIIICPKCSCPVADEADIAGIEAKQLSTLAATVTQETSRLLIQLAAIMTGFKQAVASGGEEADSELGNSLGAILSSVEQVRDEMEKVASIAVATSTARLAKVTETLRLDIRALIQAKNGDRESI